LYHFNEKSCYFRLKRDFDPDKDLTKFRRISKLKLNKGEFVSVTTIINDLYCKGSIIVKKEHVEGYIALDMLECVD
ncbi:MAG: hypothetical protein MHPSP_003308, partial [Paramarteilia canceri]